MASAWQRRTSRRDVLPASLLDTIQSTSQLSTLNTWINKSTTLYNLFNSANAFTFLAPNNDAFTSWTASQGNVSLDLMEATLSYHLLQGSYLMVNFKNTAQFAPSYLTNSNYSNVTISPSGQRVEYILEGSNPQFLSNNKTTMGIATKDVICLGGLIQIVNSLLSIPTSLVNLSSQASMSWFVAILNRANFLSVGNTGLIDFVNYASFTPNMTFFVPNTEEALSVFTNVSAAMSAENLTAFFNYHIVPGNVLYSPDLVNGTVLKTTEGTNLTISTNGSEIYVNSAKVLTTDYLIVNGVIHLIDNVLDRYNTTTPWQSKAALEAAATPQKSTNAAAIGAGVAIPVVVIAAAIGLFFWFRRRKRRVENPTVTELETTPQQHHEFDATPVRKELPDSTPAAAEIHSPQEKTDLKWQPLTQPPRPHHSQLAELE